MNQKKMINSNFFLKDKIVQTYPISHALTWNVVGTEFIPKRAELVDCCGRGHSCKHSHWLIQSMELLHLCDHENAMITRKLWLTKKLQHHCTESRRH